MGERRYRAEIIVYDGDNETVKVISLGFVGTVRSLKHLLYTTAFSDFFGENVAALDQWKQDNEIGRGKGKR